MRHKILAIDDEPEIVKILTEYLLKNGFDVVTAGGGAEGLAAIESGTGFDLLILDMKMPGVKGIDILEAMEKKGIARPVIILSGSIDRQKYDLRLSRLGYRQDDDFLIKPIDLKILLTTINKKLGDK